MTLQRHVTPGGVCTDRRSHLLLAEEWPSPQPALFGAAAAAFRVGPLGHSVRCRHREEAAPGAVAGVGPPREHGVAQLGWLQDNFWRRATHVTCLEGDAYGARHTDSCQCQFVEVARASSPVLEQSQQTWKVSVLRGSAW